MEKEEFTEENYQKEPQYVLVPKWMVIGFFVFSIIVILGWVFLIVCKFS